MRIYIRYTLYLYVLIGSCLAHSGSYDDFFQAIKRDDAAAVTALLRRGFDVNTPDPQLRHGLVVALESPSNRALEALLVWPGVKFDQRNAHDETPLMLAALRGNLAAVRKLVAMDADVNKTGWTALHYAATNAHLEIMQLLLDEHAYIDAESPNGSTPLMMAAQYGSAAAVRLLLEAGADPTLKNQLQLTATDFARLGGRDDSAALLAAALRATPATQQR